jgi:hypothetical protein
MRFDARESGIAGIDRDLPARANLRGSDMKHGCFVFLVAPLFSGCTCGRDHASPGAGEAALQEMTRSAEDFHTELPEAWRRARMRFM